MPPEKILPLNCNPLYGEYFSKAQSASAELTLQHAVSYVCEHANSAWLLHQLCKIRGPTQTSICLETKDASSDNPCSSDSGSALSLMSANPCIYLRAELLRTAVAPNTVLSLFQACKVQASSSYKLASHVNKA